LQQILLFVGTHQATAIRQLLNEQDRIELILQTWCFFSSISAFAGEVVYVVHISRC